MKRKTRIISTLGPAITSSEALKEMILAGVDVFRFNMSHAQADWCRDIAVRIRSIADDCDRRVGLLFDLQGPSIRTGDLEENWTLSVGDIVEFRKAEAEPSTKYSTTVNYEELMNDVQADKMLVVDNGGILMYIQEVTDERITCRVDTASEMTSRRHINLPGTRLNLPAMTDKDKVDLTLAVELGADFVAGSFVRDAAHVEEIRSFMVNLGGNADIVSKIEDQEGVKNIESIIEASDVIMVARGDLGIEVAVEELPIVQRRIVRLCHEKSCRVIVATHMLESMIESPTPTRAEVTDIANAVFEQADAIMLSGETTIGKYPVECVKTMDRISRRMEQARPLDFAKNAELFTDKKRTIKSAVSLANSTEGAHILVFTRKGTVANLVALMRPEVENIFAFAETEEVCRKLKLSRGVTSFPIKFEERTHETLIKAINLLLEKGLVQKGDPIVVVSDSMQQTYTVDSILFHHV